MINQNKRAMDFNFVPPVVFNFWQELMNYERKRNRNSYLYYVIYEGPQLCSLLGEIRGLKRSQKTICSWAKKLYFSNSISTILMYLTVMAKKRKTTLLVKLLTKSFLPSWPPLYLCAQCEKMKNLLSPKGNFRQINSLVIYSVKLLLSRNFCEKFVSEREFP